MTTETGGIKHDQEKPKMELLSSRWLVGVAAVLTFGARKYADHNWRKGIHQSRLLGAALRHIVAYLGGQDLDSETSLSHLYHASCCLMFAAELRETHPELDDRYKFAPAPPVQPELALEPGEVDIVGEWMEIDMEGREVLAFVARNKDLAVKLGQDRILRGKL